MDNKNDKELYVQFSRKPDAVPVSQRPSTVQYYLRKPLNYGLTNV